MLARPLGGAVVSLLGATPRERAFTSRRCAAGCSVIARDATVLDLARVGARDRPARPAATAALSLSLPRVATASSGSGSARFAPSTTTPRRCANCSRSTAMRTRAWTWRDRLRRGVHAKHRLTGYHDFFVDRIRRANGCSTSVAARASWRTTSRRAGASLSRSTRAHGSAVRARALCASARLLRRPSARVRSRRAGAGRSASNVLEHIEQRVELLRALRERAGAGRLLIRVPVLDRDWTVPFAARSGSAFFRSRAQGRVRPAALRARARRSAGWEMGEPAFVWGEIWVEALAR